MQDGDHSRSLTLIFLNNFEQTTIYQAAFSGEEERKYRQTGNKFYHKCPVYRQLYGRCF